MAKNNALLYILAGLGGTALAYQLVKLFVKPKYLCPKCGGKIDYHVKECPHCHEPFVWKF